MDFRRLATARHGTARQGRVRGKQPSGAGRGGGGPGLRRFDGPASRGRLARDSGGGSRAARGSVGVDRDGGTGAARARATQAGRGGEGDHAAASSLELAQESTRRRLGDLAAAGRPSPTRPCESRYGAPFPGGGLPIHDGAGWRPARIRGGDASALRRISRVVRIVGRGVAQRLPGLRDAIGGGGTRERLTRAPTNEKGRILDRPFPFPSREMGYSSYWTEVEGSDEGMNTK